jgi:hypothetical protein
LSEAAAENLRDIVGVEPVLRNAAIASAVTGRPPIAYTSLNAFAAAICP